MGTIWCKLPVQGKNQSDEDYYKGLGEFREKRWEYRGVYHHDKHHNMVGWLIMGPSVVIGVIAVIVGIVMLVTGT